MNKITLAIFIWLLPEINSLPQTPVRNETGLIDREDLSFLESLTKDVLDSSRIFVGQYISKDFGPNNTGGTLIRPGGRDCYPSFWIRDYAMSLECGFIKEEEQRHMLTLTASTQCDGTWITNTGGLVPAGAIADHIRIDDSRPVYYPGTYDFVQQGEKTWGIVPPYCDNYFFIHMAYYYLKTTSLPGFLLNEINGKRLIDRLESAYQVPPVHQGKDLVYTNDNFRGVDFGFRDAVYITGELCMASILKYKASLELGELFKSLGRIERADYYRGIAARLKKEIPAAFYDRRGMLIASTGKGGQADVWSTALAVWYGILEGDMLKQACINLRDAYRNGTLSKNGNIRHILTTDDFSDKSVWEKSVAGKGTYQNGGYWGTPTGWVCFAIAKVDLNAARQLAKEYINDLRTGDFRKGPEFGAPWECYNLNSPQNAVYLTTVSCPYIVFSGK